MILAFLLSCPIPLCHGNWHYIPGYLLIQARKAADSNIAIRSIHINFKIRISLKVKWLMILEDAILLPDEKGEKKG